MRILEVSACDTCIKDIGAHKDNDNLCAIQEYRVVVGADAVRYLQQSIADSKGVVAQTT